MTTPSDGMPKFKPLGSDEFTKAFTDALAKARANGPIKSEPKPEKPPMLETISEMIGMEPKIVDTLGAVALAGPSMMLHGYSMVKLWQWFMVPLGLRPITKLQANGLAVLILNFRSDNFERMQKAKDRQDKNERTERMFNSILTSLACLGFGALLRPRTKR
jgi:hypothetical protein